MATFRPGLIVLLLAVFLAQGYAVQQIGNGGPPPERPKGPTTNESLPGKNFTIYSTGEDRQMLKGNLGFSEKEMTFVGLSCGTLIVPYTLVKADPKAKEKPKGIQVIGVLPTRDGQITVKADISFTTSKEGVWTKNATGTIVWGPREVKPDPKKPKPKTDAKDEKKPDPKPDAKADDKDGKADKDKAPSKTISFTTAKPGDK